VRLLQVLTPEGGCEPVLCGCRALNAEQSTLAGNTLALPHATLNGCCLLHLLQVLTPEGDRVPGSLVEAAASAAGLHLRSGCNCNPGRCMANLGIRPEEVGLLQFTTSC
jgi:hypothetical protein